ncbi:paral putative membrane protein [Escherichia coli T426]|nr:paral putative membrane protein [Escherichia coli T426]
MFNLPGWLFTVIALVLTLFVIGLIFARLYRRASAEQAFVRTGLGGQKVVMSGGQLLCPFFTKQFPST